MNSERTSQWIEMIAAVGVIPSLLFVGFADFLDSVRQSARKGDAND